MICHQYKLLQISNNTNLVAGACARVRVWAAMAMANGNGQGLGIVSHLQT